MKIIEFHKSGDFWNAYGESAYQAAKVLGVAVLQHKGQPMIGLPVHGFTQAVVDLLATGQFEVVTNHHTRSDT